MYNVNNKLLNVTKSFIVVLKDDEKEDEVLIKENRDIFVEYTGEGFYGGVLMAQD